MNTLRIEHTPFRGPLHEYTIYESDGRHSLAVASAASLERALAARDELQMELNKTKLRGK